MKKQMIKQRPLPKLTTELVPHMSEGFSKATVNLRISACTLKFLPIGFPSTKNIQLYTIIQVSMVSRSNMFKSGSGPIQNERKVEDRLHFAPGARVVHWSIVNIPGPKDLAKWHKD